MAHVARRLLRDEDYYKDMQARVLAWRDRRQWSVVAGEILDTIGRSSGEGITVTSLRWRLAHRALRHPSVALAYVMQNRRIRRGNRLHNSKIQRLTRFVQSPQQVLSAILPGDWRSDFALTADGLYRKARGQVFSAYAYDPGRGGRGPSIIDLGDALVLYYLTLLWRNP